MLGEYLAMANENDENEEITETDIFKGQEETAKLLYDVIRQQQKQQPAATQPTYITRVEQPAKAAPNYLLYIAIGIGAFLIFRT